MQGWEAVQLKRADLLGNKKSNWTAKRSGGYNGRTPTSQSDVKVLAFHRSTVLWNDGTHICHEGLVHVRGVEKCS